MSDARVFITLKVIVNTGEVAFHDFHIEQNVAAKFNNPLKSKAHITLSISFIH